MLSKAFVLLAIQTALATASVVAPNAHVERDLTPLQPVVVGDADGKLYCITLPSYIRLLGDSSLISPSQNSLCSKPVETQEA